jgi:hypothetical protein
MTTDLRDRMADEIGPLEPFDDLVYDTVRVGRRRLRRRRATVATAVAAVALATVGFVNLNTASTGGDGLAATPPAASPSTEAPTKAALEQQWAQRLSQILVAHLPAGFTPQLEPTGLQDRDTALQFLASGPAGKVQLNGIVYPINGMTPPSCATTKAQKCDVISTPAGKATLLRDAYRVDGDTPNASQVWFDKDGTRTIINLVEVNAGESQYTLGDLAALAADPAFVDLITFAEDNADTLNGYAVFQP